MIRIREINKKNIKAFFQGIVRYYWHKYLPKSFPKYLAEQVKFRIKNAREDCVNNGECLECGCKIPHLFYADKSCGGDCYPEMMSEAKWMCSQNNEQCKMNKEKENILPKPKRKYVRKATKKSDS
jgi:hypothetical protein